MVVCVRNPLDSIYSLASLTNTMCHSASPEWEHSKDYATWWDWWVRDRADLTARFFDTLLKHALEEKKNAIYIVRFEDLVADSATEMEGVMKFLLNIDDIEGTNAQRRLQMMRKKTDTGSVYKLKSSSKKMNANAQYYTDSQLDYVKEKCGHLLYLFGYTNHPDQENTTAYFNFD